MAGKTSVRVTLNRAAIAKTTERVTDKTLRETARETVRYARLYAPVGVTGNLARSIKASPIRKHSRGATIVISASARNKRNGKDYAPFVTRGTYGPIVPRRAKALRFQPIGKPFRRAAANASQGVRARAGGVIYAKSVRGQAPQPFLKEAIALMSARDRRVRLQR